MTSEEKLKHFEVSVIGRANELSQETLRQYQETLEREDEEYKTAQDQQALLRIKTEIGRLKRDCNTALAREQLDIRRQVTRRSQELTEALFEEVRKMLEVYRAADAYRQLLEQQVKDICRIAGTRSREIYLSPSDAAYKEELERSAGTKLLLAEKEFLGGVRGYVDNRRILVDYSFDTKLEHLKEEFTFEGGTSHE